jgi:hypothetical protein
LRFKVPSILWISSGLAYLVPESRVVFNLGWVVKANIMLTVAIFFLYFKRGVVPISSITVIALVVLLAIM